MLSFLTLLVLAHNAVFHFTLVPHLSAETLRVSFDKLQLARNILELGILVLIFALSERAPRAWRGPHWTFQAAWRASFLTFLVLGFFVFISASSSLFVEPVEGSLRGVRVFQSETLAWLILNSVFLAALREELFFRGWLWNVLRRKSHLPLILTIFCTSLLFSLSHWPFARPSDFAYLLASGCLLAWIRARSGLGVCIALHMGLNFLALYADPRPGGLQTWLMEHSLVQNFLALILLTFFFWGLSDSLLAFLRWRRTQSV